MRAPCPLGKWTGTPGHCQWCDALIPPGRRRTWCSDTCRRVWERNHIWRRARIYARKRAKYRCSRNGCTAPRMDVEINHITPRDGRGYTPGCWHHQDESLGLDESGAIVTYLGLEPLCAAHHREVTSAQATARAAARKAVREAE
jgi:hypothetical protein